MISIKRTVTSINFDGKYQEIAKESAKTKSSFATLPLVGSFKEYFMQVKEAQKLNKKVCGNYYNYQYDGYVFVDEMGERLKAHYLTSRFPKLLEKKGLRRMASTIYVIAVRRYYSQTVYLSSIFRNSLGTRIFLRQQISMLILITVQKFLLIRQWEADFCFLIREG